ncbi:MAG TPA: hypothetical protein VNN79_07440, partial [Actinomycetota bacterium]|nr:hypothetical protein [Actinomycetota bacterium]
MPPSIAVSADHFTAIENPNANPAATRQGRQKGDGTRTSGARWATVAAEPEGAGSGGAANRVVGTGAVSQGDGEPFAAVGELHAVGGARVPASGTTTG